MEAVMSEAERRRRLNYKKNRKKWITAGAAVIAVLILFTVLCAATYHRLDSDYYVEYTEHGDVDYTVQLLPNDFLDEWQEPGQSYVSALMKSVLADFEYELKMEAPDVQYEYAYEVVAEVLVTDNRTGNALFSPTYELLPKQRLGESSNNRLKIEEQVSIDYARYNELAGKFISTYNLTGVTGTLNVRMNVEVIGSSSLFEESSENEYFVALRIPLATRMVDIVSTSTVPSGANKVLAYKNAVNQDIFKIAFWVSAPMDLLLGLILVAFIYLTRNHDINYTIKVNRLVSNYKSYIQKINNPFDTEGYQLLAVDTFAEMLGIRDTIQSPILMNENEDKTCTRFLIPTNTKILYVYEIKVDDYDEIYGTHDEVSDIEATELPKVTPTVIELPYESAEPVIDTALSCEAEESVTEELSPEAEEPELTIEIVEMPDGGVDELIPPPVCEKTEFIPEPEITREEPDTVVADESPVAVEPAPESLFAAADGEEDSELSENTRLIDGHVVHVRYRTSFTSRLIQAEPAVKEYYSTVKNQLLFYKGVKARTSWNFESFKKGRIQCAKLNVKGSSLLVYLALDPKEYNANKYYFTDVSDKPKLSDVPMLLKVKSERSLKYALELIAIMMEKAEIELVGGAAANYRLPYESTEALIARDLIKVILPGGAVLHEHSVIARVDIDELLRDKRSEGVKESVSETVDAFPEHEQTLEEAISEAMDTPDVELSEVDFVDEIDEVYEESEEKPGVEVIGVVWPERAHKNKIYRYDPNGETVYDGDVVLVPTNDASRQREVIRKAAVAHGNHKIDPEQLHHPLKKIISVVKRKVEEALTSD